MNRSAPAASSLLAPMADSLASLPRGGDLALSSSPGCLAACALALLSPRQAFVLVEDPDAVAAAVQDLRSLAPSDQRVQGFPGPHVLEGRVLPLRWADSVMRLRVLDRLLAGEPIWAVTTPEALLQATLSPAAYRDACFRIRRGREIDRDELLESLVDRGYRREDRVGSVGEFASRGGIVDVYPPASERPVRLEFFGDEVEELRYFDPASQRSAAGLEELRVGPAWELPRLGRLKEGLDEEELDEDARAASFRAARGGFSEGLEVLLPHLGEDGGWPTDHMEEGGCLASFLGPLEARKSRDRLTDDRQPGEDPLARLRGLLDGVPFWDLGACGRLADAEPVDPGVFPVPSYVGQLDRFLTDMAAATREGRAVALTCDEEGRLARIRELLEKEGVEVLRVEDAPPRPGAVSLYRKDLARGFRHAASGFQLVGEADLWPDRALKHTERAVADRGARFTDFTELETGCMVVHVDHGIARFLGIRPLIVDGLRQDYLELEYARGDRLYVPTSQLERVQRFIGVEGGRGPKPSRLGSTRWAQARARVRKDVEKLARELLELYAHRERSEGKAFAPDTVWQQELEAGFPFRDTRDQARATREIKRDMERVRPMDRLLCGDVGFGKTEVAIRAAFKAVQDGQQVAILCPTTVLAQQHHQTFTQRLSDFPVRIAVLSRLRDPAEINRTLKAVKRGKVDVLVGTHRLLSKDVRFRELGLLIIDEEQRFGVRHKEKIKQLKTTVDVLTLTATPIPRTLNLALSGARDISTIVTPPEGRLPVKTFVQEHDDQLVKGAIEKEIARDGQVFYVHNRIETIGSVVEKLSRLVPAARIRGGHAQMDRKNLENLMLDLYEGRFDVLVSTTIIENGLDIPNVNTIIVDRADRMGMSQLYQLRGRVGRTTRQAYAYLFFPAHQQLTEIAFKRLKALEEFTELGSGFRVAMRDLELRGAGNILGADQHGFVNAVGFELYTRLLKEAVARLKGSPDDAPADPTVLELPVHAFLPEDYIPGWEDRLEAYRTLSTLADEEELLEYQEELVDRYGPIPSALEGLFRLVRLKLRATELGLESLRRKGSLVELVMKPDRELDAGVVDHVLRRHRRQVRFRERGLTLNVAGVRESATLDFLEDLLARARAEPTPAAAGGAPAP